ASSVTIADVRRRGPPDPVSQEAILSHCLLYQVRSASMPPSRACPACMASPAPGRIAFEATSRYLPMRGVYHLARTTLQDVARTAGVSLATVDRVLNRRPGVHAETAERVQQAISQLKYRPDRFAARLARGREHRFQFLLPTGTNAFMEDLAERVRVTADYV